MAGGRLSFTGEFLVLDKVCTSGSVSGQEHESAGTLANYLLMLVDEVGGISGVTSF